MAKNKSTDTAALDLGAVVDRLIEANVGFQVVYFPNNKPARRFGARCSLPDDDAKFYASDPVAALLAAVAHYVSDGTEKLREAQASMDTLQKQMAAVGESLPGLPAHAKKADGSCETCGEVHDKNPIVEVINQFFQPKPARVSKDDEDEEN